MTLFEQLTEDIAFCTQTIGCNAKETDELINDRKLSCDTVIESNRYEKGELMDNGTRYLK